MPIRIDRKTGKALTTQKLTPEQNQKAWEIMVRAYVEKYPEKLMDLSEPEKNKKEPE